MITAPKSGGIVKTPTYLVVAIAAAVAAAALAVAAVVLAAAALAVVESPAEEVEAVVDVDLTNEIKKTFVK